jgi:predicted CopG family antitoxin
MATKTISIDLEAYKRLKRLKKANESFSQTLKRVLPEPFDFQKWIAEVRQIELSGPAIEAIETQIQNRRRPSTRTR